MERFGTFSIEKDLKEYLQQISKIPLLSQEEEQELARKIQKGDQEARNRLIQANLRLVVSIAKNYLGRGLSLSDLISEGNIGLIKAAERYKPDQNTRFATYARWWIKQAILKALSEKIYSIRIPPYMKDLILQYQRLQEKQGKVTPKMLGISEKTFHTLERSLKLTQTYSLSSSPYERNQELFEDASSTPPDAEVEHRQLLEKVQKLLETLEEREKQILKMRYGMFPYPEMTLEEVGMKIGLSRERVRQIEQKALEKLSQMWEKERERV